MDYLVLNSVWNSLSASDQKDRKQAYECAKKFIQNAKTSGGVSAPVSKTCQDSTRKDKTARIDIEVFAGSAFESFIQGIIMSKAKTIWDKLIKNRPNKTDWQPWLNLHGADGSRIDEDDTVSFIHTNGKKAVKITVKPEDNHALSYWHSQFGDEESGIINVLNIVCTSDAEDTQDSVNKLFTDWLSG